MRTPQCESNVSRQAGDPFGRTLAISQREGRAVRDSIDRRARSIGNNAQARDALKALASRGRVIVRLLDAQVWNEFDDDPAALAGWMSAKRIGTGRSAAAPAQLSVPVPLRTAA